MAYFTPTGFVKVNGEWERNVEQVRAECERLHELGTMEPEDVYENVAHRNGMEVEELYELLESDSE